MFPHSASWRPLPGRAFLPWNEPCCWPALNCGLVGCLRHLEIINAGDALDDVGLAMSPQMSMGTRSGAYASCRAAGHCMGAYSRFVAKRATRINRNPASGTDEAAN